MAAVTAGGEVYQCRGLRKWADSRCEQCTVRRPAGHPFIGFYCNLHQGQAPKPDTETGKMMVSDECKEFMLQRVDSFRSEEELFTTALLATLPSDPRHKPTITGQKLLHWLTTDRKQSSSGAAQTAEGMLKMKLIQPSQAGVPANTLNAATKYDVNDPAAVRAARSR